MRLEQYPCRPAGKETWRRRLKAPDRMQGEHSQAELPETGTARSVMTKKTSLTEQHNKVMEAARSEFGWYRGLSPHGEGFFICTDTIGGKN